MITLGHSHTNVSLENAIDKQTILCLFMIFKRGYGFFTSEMQAISTLGDVQYGFIIDSILDKILYMYIVKIIPININTI